LGQGTFSCPPHQKWNRLKLPVPPKKRREKVPEYDTRNRLPGLEERTKKASELVHLEIWRATLQKQQIKRQEDADFYWWIIEKKHPPPPPPPPHTEKRENRKRLSRTLESEGQGGLYK